MPNGEKREFATESLGPGNQARLGKGPYQIDKDTDAKTWRYARNDRNAPPTAEQSALSNRLGGVVILLSEMRASETVQRLFENARDLFSATLVRHHYEDVSQFGPHLDELEQRVCRVVARPAHQRTVIRAQGFAFVCAFIGAVLAVLFMNGATWIPPAWTLDVSHMDTLFFLFSGASLGRCVGLLISFYATMDSVQTYRDLQEQLAHPLSAALNDGVLAIVAYLVFITDLIVIAVGGDGATGGLSSTKVADSAATATVFGLLVGLARAGFLERLSGFAHQAAGPK